MDTLVITDWGKRFQWHVPQINSNILDGKLDIINIPSDKKRITFKEKVNLYFELFARIKDYDVIIFRSHTMMLYILTLFFKFKIINRPKLLVLAEFAVTKKVNTVKSILKYKLLSFVLKEMDLICTFTNVYTDYLVSKIKIPRSRIFPIILAINHKSIDQYPDDYSQNITSDYILSLGRTGRDFTTFAKAIENYTNRIVLITSPKSIRDIKFKKNVEIKYNLPLNELYSYINNAKLIVVPLYNDITPTGLRMIYYAMERGKAVIMSNSSGIREYFINYNRYKNVAVDCNDYIQLQNKIEEYINNPKLLSDISKNARDFTLTYNTSSQYINTLYIKLKYLYSKKLNNDN